MSSISLPRLVYLAVELKTQLPPKNILRFLPQSEIIEAVLGSGIEGASVDLDIPTDQLKNLYDQGKTSGKGSESEFRTLISQIMLGELDLQRDRITMTTYLTTVKEISSYLEASGKTILQYDQVDLGELSSGETEVQKIPKFEIGMEPFDVLTGGFYQGISLLIARPGHGKTSIMLSMMEAARKTKAADSLWYYELEIPKSLMAYRASPTTLRTKFVKGKDLLTCGSVSITDIENDVKSDPNPDRIIFIDSPDVMAAGEGENKRFAIEDIFTAMIRLKSSCKAIICSSWPRRKDTQISLESGAEAWAKAWYSDIIIGITKLGRTQEGYSNVRINCVKNRFGLSDRDLTFQYHYGDLSWKMSALSAKQLGESDDW